MKVNELAKDRWILVICLLFVCISLVLFFVVLKGEYIHEDDSPGYIANAENLVKNSFFSQDGISPDCNRTPGYPLFLALVYVFGGNNSTIVVLQIILSAGGIYLFYKILLTMQVPHNFSVIGTAFLLLNTALYEYSFHILTECLFGFFILLSVYFLARYFYRGMYLPDFCLFTAALNYALLIRPILIYFNIAVSLTILTCCILKRLPLRLLIIFTACFALVFGGWSYRNYLHSAVFTYSTIQNHNVKDYYCRMITAYIEGITEEEALEYHNEQFALEYSDIDTSTLNAVQINVLEGKYGAAYIKTHFKEYLILNITGFLKMMLRPGIRAYLPDAVKGTIIDGFISAVVVAYLGITYLLYLAGLILTIKKIKVIQTFILILCGYLAAASAVLGIARLRAPFFPLLLLAAIGSFPAVITWINMLLKERK